MTATQQHAEIELIEHFSVMLETGQMTAEQVEEVLDSVKRKVRKNGRK